MKKLLVLSMCLLLNTVVSMEIDLAFKYNKLPLHNNLLLPNGDHMQLMYNPTLKTLNLFTYAKDMKSFNGWAVAIEQEMNCTVENVQPLGLAELPKNAGIIIAALATTRNKNDRAILIRYHPTLAIQAITHLIDNGQKFKKIKLGLKNNQIFATLIAHDKEKYQEQQLQWGSKHVEVIKEYCLEKKITLKT